MRKVVTRLLERLSIRQPYLYFEVPRRNFFIGFNWSWESHTRPVRRGGVAQRVERTEYFREFKLRLSLLVSIVFVCAVPPLRTPTGEPTSSDWPNIGGSLRPIFFNIHFGPRKNHLLSRLMEKGLVRLR